MVYLILVLILGLPFSPLLFYKTNIWHSTGFFATVIIWVGFGLLLLGAAKQRFFNNLPVFLLYVYAGTSTGVICYTNLIQDRYNTGAFFPFFNLITILLLYYLITNYIPKSCVPWLIKALQWVVLFNAILCTLQYFGLAQFTKLAIPIGMNGRPNSEMIGFIGNGTHLSAFIGMMFPILFISTSRRNILTAVLCLILLCLCGEVNGDPALTGWAMLCAYLFYWTCFHLIGNRKYLWFTATAITVTGIAIFLYYPHFFNDNGRLEIWGMAANYIQQHLPITGSGLGSTNILSLKQGSPFTLWRHLHQEYLQYTLELGLIGLALISNVVYDFIKTRALCRTELCLKLSFIGFLLACCFLSSSHLWVMSVYATIVYSLFKVVNEDTKWQLLQEKKLETE